MKKLAFGVLLCCVSGAALAGQATVSWTMPTQFVDNTTLALSDLASTTVEYGSCNGTAFGTKQGQVVVNAPAITADIPNLNPGTYCFRAFVTTTAAKGTLSSAASNVASKTIPFPSPKPPTIIDVVIAWLKGLFHRFA